MCCGRCFLRSSCGWMNFFPHRYSNVFQCSFFLRCPLIEGWGWVACVWTEHDVFFLVLKWYILLIVEIHGCISLRLVICKAPLHAIIRWSCVVQHSTTASPTCRRCPVSSVHIFIQVPRTVGEELSHSLVRENRYYFKMHQLHPQEYVFNYHSNHCNIL